MIPPHDSLCFTIILLSPLVFLFHLFVSYQSVAIICITIPRQFHISYHLFRHPGEPVGFANLVLFLKANFFSFVLFISIRRMKPRGRKRRRARRFKRDASRARTSRRDTRDKRPLSNRHAVSRSVAHLTGERFHERVDKAGSISVSRAEPRSSQPATHAGRGDR